MKNKRLLFRVLSFLLALAVIIGLIFCVTVSKENVHTVYGSTTAKSIAGLGTDIIADPIAPTSTDDAWTGSYVYFGIYDDSPVKYRVLDSETSVFGGTTMLLDCDSVLWAGTNDDGQSSAFDTGDDESDDWATSDIRTYLNGTFLTNIFSKQEQSAIASSTKSAADSSDGSGASYLNYTPLSNDKIFILDTKEATNTSYGYSDTHSSAENRVKTEKGYSSRWWLRSADAGITDYVGIVYPDGDILVSDHVDNYYIGVSPALNINLSSVLFSSVISGTAGQTGAEYRLTLIDSDMKIAVDGTVTRKGDVITIPYTVSGANSTNVSQISVLILDKEYTSGNTNNANVIAYGVVDSTGKYTIPSELSDKVCGSDYYAYILAEDVNGLYETDYASTPVKITIKEEVVETPETEESTTEEPTKAPEKEEPTTVEPTKTPEKEESTTVEPTKAPEKEEPTTVVEETSENFEKEETTTTTEKTTTEESTTEEATSEQEEETTTIISEATSTEEEISAATTTSANSGNGDDKDDSDKGGNGWIIWLVLGIVVLFILVFFWLFIFKRKKDKDEQEVTEENKDI